MYLKILYDSPRMLGTARAAALYLALAVLLLAPLSLHPASRAPDDGDALYSVWIAASASAHLNQGYPGVLEANAFYPHPSALAYSEPLLGQALLGWPLFRVFADPLPATNLLLILTLALSALGAHLLLRELTGDEAAAVCGAVFYAFNSYSLSQLPRLQLVTLQWIPLALFFLHRYLARHRSRDAWAFGACGVLQGLSCFYYLLFYLTALAVVLPVGLWQTRSFRRPRVLVTLAAVGLACAGLLAAVVQPFQKLFHRYEFVGEPGVFDLAGLLQPPVNSLLYGPLTVPHPLPDHFLGVLALGLSGLGLLVLCRRLRAGRSVAGLGLVLAGGLAGVLAAGPVVLAFGHRVGRGPLQRLYDWPPFDQLRDPDRFIAIVLLALAFLVALAAARLLEGRSPAWVALLAVALLAEQTAPWRVSGVEVPTVAEAPEAYAFLAARPDAGPVADLPVRPFRQMRLASLDAYLSLAHGKPVLMAKPSLYPPALEWIQWSLRDFPDERSLALLRGLGFRYALVHPERWPSEWRFIMNRRLDRLGAELPLLARFDAEVSPLASRYQMGHERIHAIAPLAADPAPRACACREIGRSELHVLAQGPAERAVDGRRDTRWSTREGQHEGHQFDIVFDQPRRPVRVEIEMAFPWGEFPRNLEMNGYREGHGFRIEQLPDPAYDLALARQLIADPSRARLRYDLEPAQVDRLRLFIHRTEEATIAWSIAEIHVFEAEGAPPDRE
jgi:hypothetical protein